MSNEDGYEKWKMGIDSAGADWDDYDPEIRRIVLQYNLHLRDTPRFMDLDWRLVKAMMWTESGPQDGAWKTKPLQIGVTGDPGLRALLFGDEGSELIVPPCYVLSLQRDEDSAREHSRRRRLLAHAHGRLCASPR